MSQIVEDLRWKKFPCLNDGFVCLVDVMGGDAAIVQAARVSYGQDIRENDSDYNQNTTDFPTKPCNTCGSTSNPQYKGVCNKDCIPESEGPTYYERKRAEKDRSLLRYMMRHNHGTPFEMCLDGDTEIPTFPCYGAAVKKYTIRQISDAFQEGGKSNSWAKLLRIRTVNPQTGVVAATKIKRAWKTGVRPVFKISVDFPFKRQIVTTDNHPFLMPEGVFCCVSELKVGQSVMLNGLPATESDIVSEIKRRRAAGESLQTVSDALGVGRGVVYTYAPGRAKRKTGFFKKAVGEYKDPHAVARRLKRKSLCEVVGCGRVGEEIHHVDENPQNNASDNLIRFCRRHHKHAHTMTLLEKAAPGVISSIEYVGERDVYDIEVYDENHTFVADGFVVHNCEIKLLVRVPMDTWRQWVRHRTACLTGDVELHFDLPGGIERRGNQLVKMKIADVYCKFQPTSNATRSDKQGNPYFKRDRVQSMNLRCLDEQSKKVIHTNIVDIWETGFKPVYEIILENGASIKSSKDHLYFTNHGWKKLCEIEDLPVGVGCASEFLCITENVIHELYGTKMGHASDDDSNDKIDRLAVIGAGSGTGMRRMLNLIDTETEEWLPVVGWEDYYEISNQGRVRRIVGGRGSRSFGRCKQITISDGRAVVSLNRPGVQVTEPVHRLMAFAFFGAPEDGQECCHNDGNSLNNLIDNLRWDSTQSNADDRVRDGATTALQVRWERIVSIKRLPDEMTYDLEVSGDWHNFSANGVVVHNSVNEYSTRYSEAIDSAQVTYDGQWRLQSTANRQGSSGFVAGDLAEHLSDQETRLQDFSRKVYEERIAAGVAREQARKDLPLSTYTEAYWKCDLRNVLHFLGLRMDSHAQQEIREYATIIGEQIVKPLFPLTWEAFVDYRLESMQLSRLDVLAIRRFVEDGRTAARAEYLTDIIPNDRERAECVEKLVRLGFVK